MFKLLLLLSAPLFFSVASQASCGTGNSYLLKTNGEPQHLSFYEALNACPIDKHLPTARELAIIAEANGAKGIMEIDAAKALGADPDAYPRTGANLSFYQKTGYDLVDTFVPGSSGVRDRFYFNATGYVQPTSLSCDSYDGPWSWSASLFMYAPNAYSYQFESENGNLVTWNTSTHGSTLDNRRLVMCLPN